MKTLVIPESSFESVGGQKIVDIMLKRNTKRIGREMDRVKIKTRQYAQRAFRRGTMYM